MQLDELAVHVKMHSFMDYMYFIGDKAQATLEQSTQALISVCIQCIFLSEAADKKNSKGLVQSVTTSTPKNDFRTEAYQNSKRNWVQWQPSSGLLFAASPSQRESTRLLDLELASFLHAVI